MGRSLNNRMRGSRSQAHWGTEGYGVDFGLDQYAEMAELARTIKGKMVVSVNDIKEMHEAFSRLHIQSVDINYTVSGANKSARRSELIITNF